MKRIVLICLTLLSLNLVLASNIENNVTLELVKSGDSFWSPSSSQELFNFTVDNQNGSYSFENVNITLPTGFSFSGGLGNSLSSSWDCGNISSVITCNTTNQTLNLTSINIWFNATSSDWNNETNVSWVVVLDEELQLDIETGIDGKAPQTGQLNMTYMGSELEDGRNVTKRENITLTITVTDQGIGVDKVWVNIYNSSDNVVQSLYLEENSTFSGEVVTESLDIDDYTIKVFTNDTFDNLNDSAEVCVFTVNPLLDFGVGNFSWEPINPYPGQNLTVFSNIAMANTNDQNVSLVWKLDGEVECQEIINSTREVNCTFTGFSGEGNVSLEVDPENNISETSEDNNYHSEIISTDLNVTILDVIYKGEEYNSTDLAYVEHNETITLNVSIKYWNNKEPVSELNLTNFGIYDKWSDSGEYEDKTDKITGLDSSLNSSGIYLINYTTPYILNEVLEYGEHEIKLEANNTNYSGSSTSKYFLDGPYLTFFLIEQGTSKDLEGASSRSVYFDINITNEGNYTIESVHVVSIEANNGATIPETDVESCKDESETIEPGEQVVLCSDLELEVREIGDTRVEVEVKGNYDSKSLKFEGRSSSVYAYDTGTPEEDDDNSETEEEDPDGLLTQSVSGPAPTTSSSTESQNYISIISSPDKIKVEQGEGLTTTVKVKNDNEIKYQFIKLEIDGIDSSWVTVIPSSEVEVIPMDTKEYSVEFNIPKDAEIKEYEGDFKASSSIKTKKRVFILSILPGSELKTSINQTIENYQDQIQELENNITEMKSKGYNITEAERKLQELKDEFNKLITFRDGGNYKSAYELLDETGNLLNETASVISGAVIIPSTNLMASYEFNRLLPGLFGLLLVAGGYTFWGRYFGVKEKVLKKVKGVKSRPKFSQRKADLEIIAGKVRKKETKPVVVETKKKSKLKPRTSSRMDELEMIKSLVKGK